MILMNQRLYLKEYKRLEGLDCDVVRLLRSWAADPGRFGLHTGGAESVVAGTGERKAHQ